MASCGGGAVRKQDNSLVDVVANSVNSNCDTLPCAREENNADIAWIKHLNSLKSHLPVDGARDVKDAIDVYFKYNKPIDGYEVSILWQPFESMCETGVAIINLRDSATNANYHIVYAEKYSSYHIGEIAFAQGFKGFNDGDVYILDVAVPEQPHFYEKHINYYMSIQFFDADFDGARELLISDWGWCRQGNTYNVYDLTNEGFVLKTEAPYDDIDNCTRFNADKREIEGDFSDGVFSYSIDVKRLSSINLVYNVFCLSLC